MSKLGGPEVSSSEFAASTTAAALAMRKAFVELAAALPGNIRRAIDFERALDLEHNLAWSVFQVISAANILGVANRIPKAPSIRRILKASEKRGVRAEVIDALRAASEQFEEVVRVHAKNRVTFDAMVRAVSSEDGGTQIGLIERRNAFRAEAHIWGNQADTVISSLLVKAGSAPDTRDMCAISGRFGWRRIRPQARAVAFGYSYRKRDGAVIGIEDSLDRAAHEMYGAALLPAFCSQPMPLLKKVTSDEGVRYELDERQVGVAASVDLAFGTKVFGKGAFLTKEGKRAMISETTMKEPAVRLIKDLVVHRPSFGRVQPELLVLTELPAGFVKRDDPDADVLPVRADIVMVDGGIAGASTPEVPRHAEMLTYGCEKLGWNRDEFDVYRATIEYPILHSLVRLQCDYEIFNV